MKKFENGLVALSALILTVLWTAEHARAEEAPPESNNISPANEDPARLETVVVTGTARSEGKRKVDASFSITTATEEQIKRAAPTSTADLLKIVPGAFVESTGGNAGANIQVRGFPSGGDAPYATLQLNGLPLYPPPTLFFLENSSLFRLDDTIDRVEVLRGGPSTIFSNGQPGITANFIQKKGGEKPEGSLRLTTGTGSLARFDAYYGGKLTDDWYISGGGFYRTTRGVRDPEFPADRGGQIVGMLTRKLSDGELSVYARSLNDKNAYYTGVPLISSNNGSTLSAFPGFDPLTGTFMSRALRNVTLEVGPGETRQLDLADGRGAKIDVFGISLDKKVGAWRLSEKLNYLQGDAPTNAIFTGSNPLTLSSFIDNTIASANGNPAVLAAAGVPATFGTATFAVTGEPVDSGRQVIQAGLWSVNKRLRSVVNDLRISRDLPNDNILTVGLYHADYSSKDMWNIGNNTLMTAESNAQPINVRLNNGVIATRDGFTGASTFLVNARYSGRNTAVFIADEWKASDRLYIDGGVRYERQRVTGLAGGVDFGVDLDGNSLTLYNNNAAILNSTTSQYIDYSAKRASWTAGANYYLARDTSVYGRLNHGYAFPHFDNLRERQSNTKKIDQFELGLKINKKYYGAFLTGYHNSFKGERFSFLTETGETITSLGDANANGIEVEGVLRPTRNLELLLSGNWMNAKYRNFGANSGNFVQRQPRTQLRFTPMYTMPLQDGTLRLYATYSHVGQRFSDVENQQALPRYRTLDIGAVFNTRKGIELRFTGTNITNELGLTEGNPRIIGSAVSAENVFIGRPLFGRAFQLSLAYKF